MAADEGNTVNLYIYDLTHGFASLLAPAIIGRSVEGVWHTALVVYDREFFYGGGGITSCAPGGTQLGAPHRVERLGETFVPFQVFVDYIQGLSTTTYSPSAYNLLEHNCNHFSDEVAQFLCGARIPKHILDQPEELLNPQQRGAIQALLTNLLPEGGTGPQMMYGNANGSSRRQARQDSPEYLTLNNQIEEARLQSQELEQRRSTLAEKLARKERKKEKKRQKQMRERGDVDGEDDPDPELEMAEAVEVSSPHEELSRAGPSSEELELEAEERRQEEERRRNTDSSIVFKDIDGAVEFEKLSKALERVELTAEERQCVDELQQYLVHGEGSWVLGDDFLAFMGRLLNDESLGVEVRVCTMRCLASAALREDVSLVLHQDRRHHALLSYANRIDLLDIEEQRALALFMCNLFENLSSSEWLLYISSWESDGKSFSNIRVTTKVCVHATLSSDAELREAGTALMYNFATREVFDEVCVELAMALLQLLQYAPIEEHLYRACKSLAKLAHHSQQVPQLVLMVGPDPTAFRGTSPRVDEQIDLILEKIK